MDTVFFVISKLVWTLIRPETWFILALLASLVLLISARTRAAAKLLAVALSGLVLIAVFPLGDLLIRPLERAYPVNPPVTNPSHIIVLGGSEISGLTAVWKQPQLNGAAERYFNGIFLAQQFPETALVFTGGSGALRPSALREASIAESIFLGVGLPRDRFVVESASRNTAENARNTRALLGDDLEGPILLVTSASHMPRAMAVFCTAGWTNMIAWPVDFQSGIFWDRIGWNLAGNLEGLNKGAKEWVGYMAYRATGRISAASAPGCGPQS